MTLAPEALAELVASDGARFPLGKGAALIGRPSDDRGFVPDIDLSGVPNGKSVSRRHARIFHAVGAWHLRPEPSARSVTFVAGQKLSSQQQAPLRDGDEIKLGKVSLTFRSAGVPPPSDPNATIISPRQAVAEIRSGEVQFPLVAPDGRSLSLGRHSEDRRYRPDIDLGDVPGGSTVSRRHGELLHRGGAWLLRVQADVTNPTYLNGTQLECGQEVELSDGDRLRLGRALATFHMQRAVRYVDAEVLDLTLGPPREARIEPGAQHSLPLSLVNFSGQVDWFALELTGVPPDWYRIELPNGDPAARPVVRLLSGPPPVPTAESTARATLVLSPPRHPHARAGTYPLLLSATSQGQERLRRTATGQLIVLPFVELRLTVEPAEVRDRRAIYVLGLANNGNTPLAVSLAAATTDKLQTSLEHDEITLANGADSRLALDVRVKRRPWFGPEIVHDVKVIATAEKSSVEHHVQLTCPPRIPVRIQRVFSRIQSLFKPVLVPLAVLAVTAGVAFLILRPPEVKLTADRDIVGKGESTAFSWNIERGSGTAILDTPDGPRELALQGSGLESPKLQQTTEFKLNAHNWFGIIGAGSARVRVVRVVSFTATPSTIRQVGDEVKLEWVTENASRIRIEPAQEVAAPPNGNSVVVRPTKSVLYQLIAIDEASQAQDRVTAPISFGNATIKTFDSDKRQTAAGGPVTLTWAADGFTRLILEPAKGDLEFTGDVDVTRRTSVQVRPVHDGRYTLVAHNADEKTSEAYVDVVVVPLKQPRLQGPVRPIPAGETTTLSWQAEGANDRTTAVIQPEIGDVTGKTSVEIEARHTNQYTLVLTGPDGKSVSSEPVTLTVVPSVRQFSVAPVSITEDEPVNITWDVLEADSVTVTRDDGKQFSGPAAGNLLDHPPLAVTSYSIKGHNGSGDSLDTPRATFKIKVNPAPTPTPLPSPTPLPLPTAAATLT
jgi:pSer/pThr/pTyr-binding forkhead associated (FHA) protein